MLNLARVSAEEEFEVDTGESVFLKRSTVRRVYMLGSRKMENIHHC
jgi:hypothetical protein